jgi:glycerol-3-phosphate dehydrogenase
VDAIHRPLGAHDTDAVKRRTRAGMGPCQGNFCESRVAKILAREYHVSVNQINGHSTGSSILPHRRLNNQDKQLLRELALAKLERAKL